MTPSRPSPVRDLQLAALLVVAAVLFFANTWGYDLWPPDEPRFGQVAREMMQSGDYLAPHVNGQPYKEKPPLLFWAIAAVSWPFGDVTEFSARVPSGLAALLTVLFTYLLAARLYDRTTAALSALVLMTTALFWWEARSVRCDMILTACMTGALVAFHGWHVGRRGGALLAFYAAIAAGLYVKGPVAVVFPLLLIVTFYWKQKATRRELHWVVGLLVAGVLVLAWFVPARLSLGASAEAPGSGSVGAEMLRMTLGRFLFGVSKAQWPWYYLKQLPGDLLPWSLFLPWTLPWVWRHRREDEAMRLLLAWTVPAFVFFSISIGKRGVYLLPIYPALAIVLARSVQGLMASDRALWRRRTAYVWAAVLLLLGCAPFGLLLSEYRHLWSGGFLFISVCALLFGGLTFLRAVKTPMRTLHGEMAAHFAVMALLLSAVALPAVNAYKGAGAFCEPLRDLSEDGASYRLYTLGFSREEYIFYSQHFHTPVLNDLLPVALPDEIDTVEMAKHQRKLRKAIAKAVEDVPVADLARITAPEHEALRKAVHEALSQTDVPGDLAAAFEAALRAHVAAFALEFAEPAPAFLFVQREDWKWLHPLFPASVQCIVVAARQVGSRDMLLMANASGADLLKPARPALAP